jgi:hypothetical protein
VPWIVLEWQTVTSARRVLRGAGRDRMGAFITIVALAREDLSKMPMVTLAGSR